MAAPQIRAGLVEGPNFTLSSREGVREATRCRLYLAVGERRRWEEGQVSEGQRARGQGGQRSLRDVMSRERRVFWVNVSRLRLVRRNYETKQERKRRLYLCCVSMHFPLSSQESLILGALCPCPPGTQPGDLHCSATHLPAPSLAPQSLGTIPNVQSLYVTPPYSTSAPRPGFPRGGSPASALQTPTLQGLLEPPSYMPLQVPAHCLRQEPSRSSP